MKIPRIVKMLVLVLAAYIAYQSLYTTFFLSGEDNHPLTGFALLSVSVDERGTILISIKNTGNVELTEKDINVYTTGRCELVRSFTIEPGEEVTIKFLCPEGEIIRVEGAGRVYQKRLLR